jgi:hypothetical protein
MEWLSDRRGNIGRQQIPVGYGHEPEHNPARIDLQDAPQPGHGGPEMALDIVMDAVGATVAGSDIHSLVTSPV